MKNGMHLKKLPDSLQIKKLFMSDQDSLGLEVKTQEILSQLIIYSTEDQVANLLLQLINKLNGGQMEMELEVKNGMHLKKLPDSLQIKKLSMKAQDNHGLQVKIQKIKNTTTIYSTKDHFFNHWLRLI